MSGETKKQWTQDELAGHLAKPETWEALGKRYSRLANAAFAISDAQKKGEAPGVEAALNDFQKQSAEGASILEPVVLALLQAQGK